MQSDGVLLQQKSTANTDGCIYSAYFEIILFFNSVRLRILYFFFILLLALDRMFYNMTVLFLLMCQIPARTRCIFVFRDFECIGGGVNDTVAAVGGTAQGIEC